MKSLEPVKTTVIVEQQVPVTAHPIEFDVESIERILTAHAVAAYRVTPVKTEFYLNEQTGEATLTLFVADPAPKKKDAPA